MIRLFLNNREVELDKSVSFAINKQFEDLTSPADIRNDWSKTVQIPFTQSNHALFGDLFSPDRLIVEGDDKLMGIYFDPYKKVDFRLQWGNAVIMQGYAKNIDVVKSANGEGHYNITLNGELGKIFQEMKKITFDRTTEDTNYLIDGSKYINEKINKDLIYTLWTSEPNLSDLTLYETDETATSGSIGYRVQDILGFAPNNSFVEKFDYKTFQKDEKTSMSFAEVLNQKANSVTAGKTYVDFTGIEAETVIGEGLLPREIGEYRSYYQLPYIYFNKLFQIFMEKTKELTGYDVELDGTWFSRTNPYWNRLIYMLEPFNTKEEYKSYEGTTEDLRISYFLLKNSDGIQQQPNTYVPISYNPIYSTFSNPVLDDLKEKFNNKEIDSIIINKQSYPFRLTLTNPFDYNNEETGTSTDSIIFNPTTRMYVMFRLLNENNEPVAYSRNIIVGENFNGGSINGDEWNVIKVPALTNRGNRTWCVDFPVNFEFLIDREQVGESFNIEVTSYFNDLIVYYFYLNEYDTYLRNRIVPQTMSVDMLGGTIYDVSTNDSIKRTGANFTLNDLWNNDFNVFDEILNYCKQYRIGVFCDYINNKLIFKPLSTYFKDYKILDWTDKLDMSKEFHIQPITFENKYLLFNYENYETELNKLYNEKFGRNFGEYRLTTDYEFNTNEKEMFKFSKVTIPSTDICLSWGNLYDNMNIIYTLPAEITAYNKDKDNKNINVFGSMLFFNGLSNFDNSSAMRTVNITDDTYLQSLSQTYFYTQNGQEGKYIIVTTYPLLDVVNSENLCTFATPSENYTFNKDSYNNTKGIYHNFWEKYLNERYNKQNKVVTCYLRLTPYDIANFEYRNFIKIDNQLYMINKIYDYQLDENIPTKVDLITIQNVIGYTEENFALFEIYNTDGSVWNDTLDKVVINSTDETKTIYITSNKDVYWTDIGGDLQDLYIDGKNGSGIVSAGELVPVVFSLNDNVTQSGTIRFESNGIIKDIEVKTNENYTLIIYDSDGTVWDSNTDSVLLSYTTEKETLRITANHPVYWTDISGDLQDLYIYAGEDPGEATQGSGVIPVGTDTDLTFAFEGGNVDITYNDILFTDGVNNIYVRVSLVDDRQFTLNNSSGYAWDEESDYIRLEGVGDTKTITFTSNSDIRWYTQNQSVWGMTINGVSTYNSSGIISEGTDKTITFAMTDNVNESDNIIFTDGLTTYKVPVILVATE